MLVAWRCAFLLVLKTLVVGVAHTHKHSPRVVRTKYGLLRGIVHESLRVEAFLGVPYATPPTGSLRYMPPVTPSMWEDTRLADAYSPVCPQRVPEIGNRTEALMEHPRGRLVYLEKLLPLLTNQSEDCLYLNIYMPLLDTPIEGEETGLPCIVYIHGESYEWNSGNPYDGSSLASYGNLIVVTLNFRLGILGFLKTGAKGSAQGNFGLLDLIAGLHWLRENLPAFGGDPNRIVLLGHDTGAALANFIAVSPVAKELLHRVILLSGSGLSPWALQRDPLAIKRAVAVHTGCHGDLAEEDLAPCLRSKSLAALLDVRLNQPRFLPGFAPFVDGAVLSHRLAAAATAATVSHSTAGLLTGNKEVPGNELGDFPERDLLFGLTSTESYLDLNAQDLEFGFNETRRDRILRTFVRNSYYFHLNEIFSTLKNEYTNWECAVQGPLSYRDSTLEVLSDGHTAAPLITVGYLHAARKGRTYFLHFQHQSGERDFPQRTGSVRGEDVPYILGLPLVGGQPFFPHNYSAKDAAIARQLTTYLANFARNGDPNISNPPSSSNSNLPLWDPYDSVNQTYLELTENSTIKKHYRGHKMSLWLNLIPQLHRPGVDELSMSHHHFQEEEPQYYDGTVRRYLMQRPSFYTPPTTTTTPTPKAEPPTSAGAAKAPLPAPTTTPAECTNLTALGPAADAVRPTSGDRERERSHGNNLLNRWGPGSYQLYAPALLSAVVIGFLFLLNVLIFVFICHQRGRHLHDRRRKKRKRKEEVCEINSCCSSSSEYHSESKIPVAGISYAHHQSTSTSPMVELQEFKSSPPSAVKRMSNCTTPTYSMDTLLTPSIPEPPPPPNQSAAGILRPHNCPQTPSSMKKRVQIQEISV
nr:PREDICTED: neuroligin-1-like [Bemisia tabaci]